MNTLNICTFIHLQLYLEHKFPKVKLPGWKIYAFVILMDFAKLLSIWGYANIYSHKQCIGGPVSYALTMECIIRVLDCCQPDRRKIVSQCSCNLHIFYYAWSWVSFQMFKDHLYFILCKLCVYIFCLTCWALILNL